MDSVLCWPRSSECENWKLAEVMVVVVVVEVREGKVEVEVERWIDVGGDAAGEGGYTDPQCPSHIAALSPSHARPADWWCKSDTVRTNGEQWCGWRGDGSYQNCSIMTASVSDCSIGL